MKPNVARVWDDEDYAYVRTLCTSESGWSKVYHKKDTYVWTQQTTTSHIQMIKARTIYKDISAETVFDVLMDNSYRTKWDKYLDVQKDIGLINPNNDISYYAVRSISPIRPRDFVLQRTWLDRGDEKLICCQSVYHDEILNIPYKTVKKRMKNMKNRSEMKKKTPINSTFVAHSWTIFIEAPCYQPTKSFVRGKLIISAYLIRAAGEGCQIDFINQSDPRGKLPQWLVNRISKVIAPKMVEKLHKACVRYSQWKEVHSPHWKPWRRPELMVDAPRVDLALCLPKDYQQDIVDESQAAQGNCDDEEKD